MKTPGVRRPYRRLLILITILLSSLTALGASAEPGSPAAEGGPDREPLVGGAPYPFPIISSPARPLNTGMFNETLTIDVWYGLDQTFGVPGTPQKWLNVMGRVTGPRAIKSLSYTLNGGPSRALSVGPDQRRLYNAGDFIIELDVTDVVPAPGTNTVVITADDGQAQTQQTVTVTYDPVPVWPLPYTADWSAVTSMTEAADPLTGLWRIQDGLLENVTPGYDRLIVLGDRSWTDYEVTVPLTVHTLNSSEWTGPSVGGGVGFIMRWPGHFQIADEQPALGWRNLGALAWFRWSPQGNTALELVGQGGQPIAQRSDITLPLGTEYIFKGQVETAALVDQPATYRFKIWPAAEAEPETWQLVATGRKGEPTAGSVVIVAHQSEVSFGDVTVTPLGWEGLTLTVDEPENGQITVTPAKPYYAPGESVTLEATADTGYLFAGWTGDAGGDTNPLTLTMTESITVGATFEEEPDPEPETYRVYISPVAAGSVGNLDFTRGDVLMVDSFNHWSPVLAAAAGPLGARSDIEAFAFLPDGSMIVALGRKLIVPGLGTVMPNDVLRLVPGAGGDFNAGSARWLIDGSDVGLTGTGERIDALATTPDGRVVISTTGTARVTSPGGAALVARDEDLIVFVASALGEATAGTWDVVCDGSLVPGLAAENTVGASLAADGTLYLSLATRFRVQDVVGDSRSVLALSSCTPDAQARLVWDGRSAGLSRPFDAMTYLP
jgi:uncharacterized repeat protein (TIGR02543 family)